MYTLRRQQRRTQAPRAAAKIFSAMALLCLVLLCVSCATVGNAGAGGRSEDFSAAGSAAPLLRRQGTDPLEGANRTVQLINHNIENHVMHPMAQVWRFLTPNCLRTALANVGENLSYPLRAVNHLLQGDANTAWIDTKRFAVNSTVGVLGTWDPASRWGLPHRDGSFRDTFAKWGMPSGCYVNLPIAGPGSARDALGRLADLPFSLPQWLLTSRDAYAVNAVLMGNDIAKTEPELYTLFNTQYNHYELFRLVTALANNPELKFAKDPQPWTGTPDPDESYGILKLAPKENAFFYRSRQRHARLADGRRVPYTCYPSQDAQTLVVILPGIGSHRNSGEVTALAELFRTRGCDTLALSSTFTPDYFDALGPNAAPPGLLADDAKTLAEVLTAAIADYREHYGVPKGQHCVLMGYSLGGLNALNLAALRQQGGAPALPIERFLAVNPPFDPMAALETVDRLYDIPQTWPEDSRDEHLRELTDRLARWFASSRTTETPSLPPMTREESLFIMGFYMRLKLVAVLQAREAKRQTGLLQNDVDAFFRRNSLFAEALGTPYRDYLVKVVHPWYKSNGMPEASAEQLAAQCRLDALTTPLRAADDVRVFQNRNDFLIHPEDLRWYEETFGKRCTLFDRGGHLGTLPRPEYQNALLKALLD